MQKSVLFSLAAVSCLTAGGYKIPENSLNSVALSAAYVAGAHGADAAYYNPANMAFEDSAQKVEGDLTYIGLSKITFDGTVPTAGSGVPDASGAVSEAETFVVPSLFYVSPSVGDFRFGFGMVVPAGLSKRWQTQPARGYANEFTLETVEFNPVFSYRISESVALGGGVRVVYTSGIVKSASTASRDMAGDSVDFGYNLSVSYRPDDAVAMAVVYRSNIDLNVEGNAKLYFPDNGDFSGPKVYDGDAKVSVPIPAMLQLAGAYTFGAGSDHPTTLEIVYERNFWSSYEALDFDYAEGIGVLEPSFGDPIDKSWNDTSTVRIGVTQGIDAWTLMAGAAYDESPVPEETLNFELPDADAWIVSAGVRWRFDTAWEAGVGVLYDMKQNRTVRDNDNGIDGTFKDASALLATLGLAYRF